jgi:hypothetical protein
MTAKDTKQSVCYNLRIASALTTETDFQREFFNTLSEQLAFRGRDTFRSNGLHRHARPFQHAHRPALASEVRHRLYATIRPFIFTL